MAIDRLLQDRAFKPEQILRIVAAHDEALLALGFPDIDGPVAQLVAKKNIEIALSSEIEPFRLSRQAISDLGIPHAA